MKIEVGTEMCIAYHDRWIGQETFSNFQKVVKMTAKRAELSNGRVISLEPKIDHIGTFFKTYGGKNVQYWYIVTPEMKEAQKAYEHKKNIERWFDAQNFTNKQKEAIYNLLK